MRMALARNDAMVDLLLTAARAGTESFASWRATQNGLANFNYALPRGGRAFRGVRRQSALQALGA